MIEKTLKEKISLAKSRFADKNINLFLEKGCLVGSVDFLSTKIFFENFAKSQNIKSKILAKFSNKKFFQVKKFSDIHKFPKSIRILPNGKNNLNSQIEEKEIVQGFQIFKNLIFVETEDFANGWTEKENLEILENFDEKKFRKNNFLKTKNQNLKIKNLISLKKIFSKFSKKWLGTKYLLGGKSLDGIDCSGLTQKLFYEIFGFLLPRNSFKQSELFDAKKFEERDFLDFIFCKKKIENSNHIVICVDKNQIFQASLSEKKVCFSSTEDFLEKYNVIKVCDIRKILNLKTK